MCKRRGVHTNQTPATVHSARCVRVHVALRPRRLQHVCVVMYGIYARGELLPIEIIRVFHEKKNDKKFLLKKSIFRATNHINIYRMNIL